MPNITDGNKITPNTNNCSTFLYSSQFQMTIIRLIHSVDIEFNLQPHSTSTNVMAHQSLWAEQTTKLSQGHLSYKAICSSYLHQKLVSHPSFPYLSWSWWQNPGSIQRRQVSLVMVLILLQPECHTVITSLPSSADCADHHILLAHWNHSTLTWESARKHRVFRVGTAYSDKAAILRSWLLIVIDFLYVTG